MLKPQKHLAPQFKRTAISRGCARAWGVDHPVGYAFGGPAYGELLNGGGNFFDDVGSFFGDIGDSIGDTIEWVGDEVGNAFAKIDKEVFQPVGNALKPIGKAIESDPLTFVAQVAAVVAAPFTAGQSLWLLPVITAASTAAHGGSFEDVIKNAAISAATVYVGGQLADFAGAYVSEGLMTAGDTTSGYALNMSFETANAISTTVGNAIGYSAAGALGAAAAGQNSDQILTVALASGVGAALPAVVNAIPGFSSLSQGLPGISPVVGKTIQNAIIGAAGGALTGIITHKDIGQTAAIGLISSTINTLATTKNVITDGIATASKAIGFDTLSEQAQAVVANTLTKTITAAAMGGATGNVLNQAFMSVATNAIASEVKANGGLYNTLTTKVNDAWTYAKEKLSAFETVSDQYESAAIDRNSIADQANQELATQKSLKEQLDSSSDQWEFLRDGAQDLKTSIDQKYTLLQSKAGEVNSAVNNAKGMADTQSQWISKYNSAKAQLDQYEANANYWGGQATNQANYINANRASWDEATYNAQKATYTTYSNNYTNAAAIASNYVPTVNNLANQANYYGGLAQNAVTDYNTKNSQYQSILTDYNESGAKYTDMVSNANSLNTKITEYTNQINAITEKYNGYYAPTIAEKDKKIAELEPIVNDAKNQYVDANTKLDEVGTELNKNLDQINNKITEGIVKNLDPSFNAEEYKSINNLGSAVDAYSHYMTIGKNEGLFTNNAAAEFTLQAERNRVILDVAKFQGYDTIADVTPENAAKLNQMLTEKYGSNLSALKNYEYADLMGGGKTPDDYLAPYSSATANKSTFTGNVYSEDNKPKTEIKLPEGVKLANTTEIGTNKATLIQVGKDYVWASSDGNKVGTQLDLTTGEMKPLEIVIYGNGKTDLDDNTVQATSLEDMDGWLKVETLATATNKEALVKVLPTAADMVDSAKYVLDWAKNTGNPTIQTIAASSIGGFGEQFQSFAALAALAGNAPKGTDLYNLGQSFLDIQKAGTPAEFAKRFEEFQSQYKDVTGIAKAGAFLKAAWDYPTEFGLGIVVPEIAQEILPLLVGGAGKVVASAASGLAAVAPTVAKWAGKLAYGGTDALESFGSNYNQTFDEAVKLASKAHPDWSQQQINEYANVEGLKTGVMGFVTTGLAQKLGGGALAESILGDGASKATVNGLGDVFSWLGSKLTNTGKLIIKEAGSEAFIEEMPTQLVRDMQFLPIDPNRDVLGNVALAGAAGALTAGSTSGTIDTAHDFASGLANAVISSNNAMSSQLSNAKDANEYISILNNYGVTDKTIQSDLANQKFANQVVTADEAAKALYDSGLTDVKSSDIDKFIGTTNSANLGTVASNYANQNMLSAAELQAVAAKEGYTLSKEQIADYTGRKDQAAAESQYTTQFDPLAVIKPEALQFLESIGYTNPTEAEVMQFVKSNPEAAVQQEVGAYVDPRQVTREEATQFYKELNYTPTEQEIQQFIKHGKDIQEAQVKTNLGGYVDPRMVDSEEARQMLSSMGLLMPMSDESVKKITGQYAESELAAKAKEALPVIAANANYEQIRAVADLVGKPASQVTQADIDSVKNMIGGKSDVNLAFDVNQDGKIDINDQTALEQQFGVQQNKNIQTITDPDTGVTINVDTTTGKQVDAWSPAAGTQWASTGIYDLLSQEKAQAAATAKAQAAAAKTATQKNQFGQIMSMLMQAPDAQGQQVTVKTPDPAKIGYFYDWNSIFATPSQAQMMPSPYGALNVTAPQQKQAANQPQLKMASGFAAGGIVGNDIQVGDGGSIDDLLNYLKGNSG